MDGITACRTVRYQRVHGPVIHSSGTQHSIRYKLKSGTSTDVKVPFWIVINKCVGLLVSEGLKVNIFLNVIDQLVYRFLTAAFVPDSDYSHAYACEDSEAVLQLVL